MKVLVALVGLLIGALVGIALLMVNPITLTQAVPGALSGAIHTLRWDGSGGHRGLPLTPRGLLGGVAAGDEAATFEDPGIRFARAEIVLLTADDDTPPALGVKLAATSRNNSLVSARLGTITAWSVAWPGRGSLLLAGSENFWAPLRDGLWSAARGRGFLPGRERYVLPPLPGLGPPSVVGGTGEFAGAGGAFRESFAPAEDDPGGFTGMRWLDVAIE